MNSKNELKIFEFEHHDVETIFYNGEPLFNPLDIGNCLGLSEGTTRGYVSEMDEAERIKIRDIEPDQNFSFKLKKGDMGFWLREPGLYQLIFKSRKPEAERFTKWVTHDVLPELRNKGSYNLSRDGQILAEIISNAETLLGIKRREIAIHQNSSWNMKLFQLILDCSRNGMGGVADLYDELCYLYEAETGFDIEKIAKNMGLTRKEYLIDKPTVCRTLYEFAIDHFHGETRQVILLPSDQTRFEVEGK